MSSFIPILRINSYLGDLHDPQLSSGFDFFSLSLLCVHPDLFEELERVAVLGDTLDMARPMSDKMT